MAQAPKVFSIRSAAERMERARPRRSAEMESLELGPIEGWLPEAIRKLLEELRGRSARLITEVNEYGYDPFGFHIRRSERLALFAAVLYRYWFRVETHGIDNIPSAGPLLLVANHAGNFAWDAAMLQTATLLEAEPPRLARGLAEYYLPTLPFLSNIMVRTGAVVGTPENCRQLFDRGECVMVFPEGARGAIKPYRNAYQLQRFGMGFMRMALEHRVPIVPVGIVGSEESSPGLWDSKLLARLVGAPGFPITFTFPWLGPIGLLLPLPVKFFLNFGPPLRFEGEHDAEDSDLEPKVTDVRGEVERLIAVGLSQRQSWFY